MNRQICKTLKNIIRTNQSCRNFFRLCEGTSDPTNFRPYTKISMKFKIKYEIENPVRIKGSPLCSRNPCKLSRALEPLNDIDRDKTSLDQQEQDMSK